MARIHGIVYLIIGIVVALYSYKSNSEKLQIFIWVGIAFAVFGFARILMNRSKKTRQRAHPGQPMAREFCSSCGSALHRLQKFCHNCGQRAFHNKKI